MYNHKLYAHICSLYNAVKGDKAALEKKFGKPLTAEENEYWEAASEIEIFKKKMGKDVVLDVPV